MLAVRGYRLRLEDRLSSFQLVVARSGDDSRIENRNERVVAMDF